MNTGGYITQSIVIECKNFITAKNSYIQSLQLLLCIPISYKIYTVG